MNGADASTADLPRYLDEPTHEWALSNLPFLRSAFVDFDRHADWPLVNVLQKRLLREGERNINVSEAAFSLPRNLGHLESMQPPASSGEQQIVLSLFALRYIDEARGLLDSFVQFIRVVVDRYRNADDQDEVVARRTDLDALGLSQSEALKLSHVILQSGVHFAGGGTRDLEAWERTVHEPALVPLLDVIDIDDYLSIEGAFLRQTPSLHEPTVSDLSHRVASGDDRRDLHPEIERACLSLFETGHYPEAVEKSYKVVRDRLRSLTGFETGSEAFGRGKLRISGAAAPHVADDFNEAVKFLTMAIDRFRNEKSHSSDGNIDHPDRAYEYISMSSLAMHLLDQAQLPD